MGATSFEKNKTRSSNDKKVNNHAQEGHNQTQVNCHRCTYMSQKEQRCTIRVTPTRPCIQYSARTAAVCLICSLCAGSTRLYSQALSLRFTSSRVVANVCQPKHHKQKATTRTGIYLEVKIIKRDRKAPVRSRTTHASNGGSHKMPFGCKQLQKANSLSQEDAQRPCNAFHAQQIIPENRHCHRHTDSVMWRLGQAAKGCFGTCL